MFEQLKGLASIMKNAGAIREQAQKLKDELAQKVVVGESGGGAVRVTMNGQGKVLRVELDEPLLAGIAGDDKLMVEELIAAAVNNGVEMVQRLVAQEMSKLTGGMNLPGMEGLLRS
ncbi:MAG: YbaB/EbfC family nucleoid-associated protein [Planctomycetes bacterium]|nr:YbaB/EbfC family nucleoid-associated protein [Planctomycetota bacterium]